MTGISTNGNAHLSSLHQIEYSLERIYYGQAKGALEAKMVDVKISVSLIISAIKWVWNIIPTLKNYALRPKADLTIKNHIIVIKDKNDAEHHINYPCLLLSFQKDVRIDLRSIKLNNETLHCLLSSDPNFLNQKESSQNKITITNNRIMPLISENWLILCQQACYFDIKRLEQEAFPLFIKQGKSHFLFNHKKDSRIFSPKNKLIISMCIEGKTYEYALPLLDVCKVIINNLSFQ
jgi:hypothetical protein